GTQAHDAHAVLAAFDTCRSLVAGVYRVPWVVRQQGQDMNVPTGGCQVLGPQCHALRAGVGLRTVVRGDDRDAPCTTTPHPRCGSLRPTRGATEVDLLAHPQPPSGTSRSYASSRRVASASQLNVQRTARDPFSPILCAAEIGRAHV